MAGPDFAEITAELAALFRAGGQTFRDDGEFDRMALRVHAAQRAANPTLRRYWDGFASTAPASWREIPPAPVAAFRDVPILTGAAEAVFRTSGTTAGGSRRGEHHVASLDLYLAAARGNYRRHLFANCGPESGAPHLALVSLIPRPDDTPDSSLSAMAGFIAREPEVAEETWAFHPQRGVDIDAVRRAVGSATEPVLVLTTAFALVQLLDGLADARFSLPADSRIMETGGFKGRVAEVDRATLYGRVSERLGVPPSCVVNEYGMTEMLSQAYDGVAGRAGSPTEREHRFPPWVRTRALDPADLSVRPPGEPGLLAHFDLANAASVCHILTEDLGCTTESGGVRLLGRAPGASLRGCSLTAESFLRLMRAGIPSGSGAR